MIACTPFTLRNSFGENVSSPNVTLAHPIWELPAVWLLADLLSSVYKRKYVADVGLSLMKASNAEELRVLRAECFPSVLVFPVRALCPPSVPAPSSRLVAPTRFESLVAHGTKRTIIDLESDSDIELLVQPHEIHRSDAAAPDVHADMFPSTPHDDPIAEYNS